VVLRYFVAVLLTQSIRAQVLAVYRGDHPHRPLTQFRLVHDSISHEMESPETAGRFSRRYQIASSARRVVATG
jgi:hypothetical protein